ncbi:MAG TPA: monofunctional biosynthetic peptidoglycan transglycosylase [Candidatus Methylomirabilis sp.]
MKRIRKLLVRGVLAVVILTVGPVLLLRWVPPPTSAFMLQKRVAGVLGGQGARIRYRWVPWEAISPSMRVAVVASEDQKFPHHWGFDVEAIATAAEQNEARRRPRGASTITQQVAKNLFLWSGPSYLRKGLEAYFTVLLELLWTKRRILEVYLNVAEFGEATFGVGAAAEAFFGASSARLTPHEAALLAAVLPNPRRFRAANPSPYVLERARWIEAQMQQLGGPTYLRSL